MGGRQGRWFAVAAVLALVAGASVSIASATTTTFDDSFDRADSTTLGNGWQEVQGDLRIGSNELRSTAGAAGSAIAVQPSSTSDQQSVSAVFARGTRPSRDSLICTPVSVLWRSLLPAIERFLIAAPSTAHASALA